jgi:hypothetical protein
LTKRFFCHFWWSVIWRSDRLRRRCKASWKKIVHKNSIKWKWAQISKLFPENLLNLIICKRAKMIIQFQLFLSSVQSSYFLTFKKQNFVLLMLFNLYSKYQNAYNTTFKYFYISLNIFYLCLFFKCFPPICISRKSGISSNWKWSCPKSYF